MIRRSVWLPLVAGVVILAAPAGAAAGAGLRPSPNLVARGADGRVLAADPRVVPGERVRLTVSGFRPEAVVTTVLAGVRPHTYRADGHGVVRIRVTVPALPGPSQRSLLVGGAPPDGPRGRGTVVLVVPTLGVFPFRIGTAAPSRAPGSGVAGVATTAPSGTGGSGGLAFTGLDALGLTALALGGVAIGGLLARAGRRRDRAGLRVP